MKIKITVCFMALILICIAFCGCNGTTGGESSTPQSSASPSSESEVSNSQSDSSVSEKELTLKEIYEQGKRDIPNKVYKTCYRLNYNGVYVRELEFDSGKSGSAVTVAMVTDSHILPRYADRVAALKTSVGFGSMFNQLVLCGDIVDSGADSSAISLYKQMVWDTVKNVFCLLGNHEYTGGTDTSSTRQKATANWPHNSYYVSKTIGGKVTVIGMDNGNSEFNAEQLASLTADLKKARKSGLKVLVFCHIPLQQLDTAVGENDAAIGLIKSYSDVCLGIFSGHTHSDSYFELNGNTPIPTYTLEGNSEHNCRKNVLLIKVK